MHLFYVLATNKKTYSGSSKITNLKHKLNVMLRFCFFLVFSFVILNVFGQRKTDTLLQNILSSSNNSVVQKIIDQPDTFRLQIIYTQINRDKNNAPSFQNYYFNFDNSLYFNPASTVKLPLAILSLEKLNKIGVKGVTKNTAMQFDSSYTGQVKLLYDSTSENYRPSIGHFVKKAFLVSDNDAYNRMYQFVGQEMIHTGLYTKGYHHTRIIRQFMGFGEEQNRQSNQIKFLDKRGNVIYTQPPASSGKVFDFSRSIKVGRGYINRNDSLVNKPIDFTRANIVGLQDLQQMLQSIIFPESLPVGQRFELTSDDYTFLHQYLSQYSSETNYPKYDSSEYFDSYVKFFFKNGSRQMPPHVRVFNKVGWAYGFLTDVSYVVDFKNKVEFMLTATVYANSDAVLNDDVYEYETIGWPFLYEVGQAVYHYELKRSRKVSPDLSQFQLRYDKRDPRDKRGTVKGVDN